MTLYLIFVEAQNFASSLFDTEDLSTIRGSSLQCLNIVKDLKLEPDILKPLTLGASAGLWHFDAKDNDEAQDVVDKARKYFGEGNALHFTFATACTAVGEGDTLLAIKDRLVAAIRRQQLSHSALAYPEQRNAKLCPVDLVRPIGNHEIWYGGKKQKVSDSVDSRRKHGVDGKQKLIGDHVDQQDLSPSMAERVGADVTAPFAFLLSSISESATPPQALKSNLHDKIAVIHFDGNGFSKVQNGLISGATDLEAQMAAQERFDNNLMEFRRTLVTSLMSLLESGGGVGKPSDDEVKLRQTITKQADQVIRFEMLLWGGDEMTFIVPARLGWEVAEAIVKQIDDSWKIEGKALTAAISLVFCHHDAPIARIRALADRLVTHLKETPGGREATQIFPLALESFDHIGEGLDDYLNKRTGLNKETGRDTFFALDKDELPSLRDLAKALNVDPDFSRSRLRALAQAAHDNSSRLAALVEKSSTFVSDNKAALCRFAPESENYRRAWMLLEECWDYLTPCDNEQEAKS